MNSRSVDESVEISFGQLLSANEITDAYNLNQGIKASSGEFIKYLCEDDYLPRNSIKDSVEGMKDYDFINGNAVAIYMEGMHAGKHLDYIPERTNPTFEQLVMYNSIHLKTEYQLIPQS